MVKNDIYEQIKFKDSKIPFVWHSLNFTAGQSLGRHNWHESIEILYFTEGSAVVTCAFKKTHVNAGDIVIINSNTLHNIEAKTDTHFYCLIIDNNFCIANYIDTSAIYFTTLVRDDNIRSLIDTFTKEYYDYDFICRPQLLRSSALRILALLKSNHTDTKLQNIVNPTMFDVIKKVLNYIHTNSHNKISLDELSQMSGISKFYLSREFRKLVGYTIIEYTNRVRCENAKRMIQENKHSLATIAISCGYPTPSYFTKTFVELVGLYPSEYRKEILKSE